MLSMLNIYSLGDLKMMMNKRQVKVMIWKLETLISFLPFSWCIKNKQQIINYRNVAERGLESKEYNDQLITATKEVTTIFEDPKLCSGVSYFDSLYQVVAMVDVIANIKLKLIAKYGDEYEFLMDKPDVGTLDRAIAGNNWKTNFAIVPTSTNEVVYLLAEFLRLNYLSDYGLNHRPENTVTEDYLKSIKDYDFKIGELNEDDLANVAEFERNKLILAAKLHAPSFANSSVRPFFSHKKIKFSYGKLYNLLLIAFPDLNNMLKRIDGKISLDSIKTINKHYHNFLYRD